jgi:alpha-1,4-digalacturonate transport system permease protein
LQTVSRIFSVFFNLFEPLFRVGQRWLGLSRIGWLFVGPNLLVFGLFTFLPIVVNFVYAATGGVKLMPFERPFTGAENFGSCSNAATISISRPAGRMFSGGPFSTPRSSA